MNLKHKKQKSRLYESHEDAFLALKRIAQTAKTKDEREELGKIVAVYQEAKEHKDFSIVKGQRNCNTLSDATIALEADDAIIYTTDQDYEYICPAFNRKFIRELY
jgi:hypothetical protein